jgi:hypothetical protein
MKAIIYSHKNSPVGILTCTRGNTYLYEEQSHLYEGQSHLYEGQTHLYERPSHLYEGQSHLYEGQSHLYEGQFSAFMPKKSRMRTLSVSSMLM